MIEKEIERELRKIIGKDFDKLPMSVKLELQRMNLA